MSNKQTEGFVFCGCDGRVNFEKRNRALKTARDGGDKDRPPKKKQEDPVLFIEGERVIVVRPKRAEMHMDNEGVFRWEMLLNESVLRGA